MALGDGTFVSMMNHYQNSSSMREIAHAAVDNLHGLQLRLSHGEHG
jgi:hypothetical protein